MSGVLVTVAALTGLVGTLIGALVSFRLVRPRQQQIIAQAERDLAASKNEASEAATRLIERYEVVVERQDERLAEQAEQIAAQDRRIDDLVEAERACEARADELAHKVSALESVLEQHGLSLNGS